MADRPGAGVVGELLHAPERGVDGEDPLAVDLGLEAPPVGAGDDRPPPALGRGPFTEDPTDELALEVLGQGPGAIHGAGAVPVGPGLRIIDALVVVPQEGPEPGAVLDPSALPAAGRVAEVVGVDHAAERGALRGLREARGRPGGEVPDLDLAKPHHAGVALEPDPPDAARHGRGRVGRGREGAEVAVDDLPAVHPDLQPAAARLDLHRVPRPLGPQLRRGFREDVVPGARGPGGAHRGHARRMLVEGAEVDLDGPAIVAGYGPEPDAAVGVPRELHLEAEEEVGEIPVREQVALPLLAGGPGDVVPALDAPVALIALVDPPAAQVLAVEEGDEVRRRRRGRRRLRREGFGRDPEHPVLHEEAEPRRLERRAEHVLQRPPVRPDRDRA